MLLPMISNEADRPNGKIQSYLYLNRCSRPPNQRDSIDEVNNQISFWRRKRFSVSDFAFIHDALFMIFDKSDLWLSFFPFFSPI